MKIKLLFALIFLFGLSAFSEGFCCSDKTGSTSKFAPENFFGGIYANLKSLRADKVYQTLPIDQLTYTDIFVERFDADVVRELALFAGVNQNASRPDLPFELAAAARLTAPASIEQVFTSWQASANIPITFDDSGIEPVAIEGRDCFRCPTGTFLSSRNPRGTFQWRERSGKALTNGINVGSAGPRRYLNGRDAGCELAVLFELQPEDFADGKLKFVFEPEIFRIVNRKYHSHLNLHFYLQKPSSDGRIRTCSKVAAVELVSKVQSEVTFEDSTVGNSDGISAFVADGKLELVVAFENKSTYVGFAPSDIELVQDEHEWVFLDEENFVVAQSRSRLIEMISGQGKEQSNKLASELTPMDREEVRIYADLKNQAELIACNELLTHLSVPLNGDVIQIKDACEINAAVSLADPHLVKANFRFANSDHAESAAETIKQWQQVLRIRAAKHLVEFALTERKLRSLAGYAMLGDSNWTIASRELEDLLAENELTKSVVEDLVGGLFVAKSAFGNQVSLSFAMPSWFAKSTPQQLHALQLIKLQRARECHQLGKHNLHSKLLRKAIAQTPKDRELWKSAAYQLSYNVAAEFDSVEIRYQWVRQGILLSLDGYEHEPPMLVFCGTQPCLSATQLDPPMNANCFDNYFPRTKRYSHA